MGNCVGLMSRTDYSYVTTHTSRICVTTPKKIRLGILQVHVGMKMKYRTKGDQKRLYMLNRHTRNKHVRNENFNSHSNKNYRKK